MAKIKNIQIFVQKLNKSKSVNQIADGYALDFVTSPILDKYRASLVGDSNFFAYGETPEESKLNLLLLLNDSFDYLESSSMNEEEIKNILTVYDILT